VKDKTQLFRKVFRIGTLQKSFTIFHRLRRKYAFHYEKLCRCESKRKDLGANSHEIHALSG
jgi:hypothetical protein